MNLIDGIQPLPFMWDITLYTNPPVLKPPRVPSDKVGSVPGDKTYQGQHESDEDSEDDPLEPIEHGSSAHHQTKHDTFLDHGQVYFI